jgi:hypothetical protein
MAMHFNRILAGAWCALVCPLGFTAPLSKTQPVDFYADFPSRNLQGIATRSDGRLLPGPAVGPLDIRLGNSLLWTLAADGDKVLIGTGPDGKVLSVNPNVRGELTPAELLDLPETHVFAVVRLTHGDLLVGTSPQGTLVLAREGKVVARTALPVDSIFDIAVGTGEGSNPAVLVATGNPGRIYRVDLAVFGASGDHLDKVTTADVLASRGITLFGEIRDRNVRRLLQLTDGRVMAGSAPRGNVYEFESTGGAPRILLENRNAEVADLLSWEGGFFAAVTFAAATGDTRLNPPRPAKPEENPNPPAAGVDLPPVGPPETPARMERFAGRSQLWWFPEAGFPEAVVARTGVAFYRLARHDGLLLIAGGEAGELLGYDPRRQRSLTFPGVAGAQLNGLLPAAKIPGAFHAIANNPSGLHLINFPGAHVRTAESRRIDLGTPSLLGLVRFGSGTQVEPADLKVELRTSFGSDETEGWTPWRVAAAEDGGWRVPELRGRHVQLRLTVNTGRFGLDRAELHHLPQNRRPQLQEFRLLSPNFGLVPAPEPATQVSMTLGQLLQPPVRDDEKRRSPLLASQIVPQPGAQVAVWTVNDPDGDDITCTFSLRPAGSENWTDLAVATRDSFLQFDISHLPEGVYQTRLVASETSPRPESTRLSAVFETDNLLIDRTPPVLDTVQVRREAGRLRIMVTARDEFSRLAGVEFSLNNGVRETIEQPDDGILDGRTESFTLDLPAERAARATNIEVIVYDATGNSAARRLPIP